MSKKVYIVGGDLLIERMFSDRGWKITPYIKDADLLQFTGGEDVHPHLYNKKNTQSHSNLNRDLKEAKIYYENLFHTPMAGICRGGQFLNVMNGGSMIQDVDGHATAKGHKIYSTGLVACNAEVHVTSTHHQMMVVGKDGELLYYATESPGFRVEDKEVVFYPITKCLCFQPHPEYNNKDCEDLYFQLLKTTLGV